MAHSTPPSSILPFHTVISFIFNSASFSSSLPPPISAALCSKGHLQQFKQETLNSTVYNSQLKHPFTPTSWSPSLLSSACSIIAPLQPQPSLSRKTAVSTAYLLQLRPLQLFLRAIKLIYLAGDGARLTKADTINAFKSHLFIHISSDPLESSGKVPITSLYASPSAAEADLGILTFSPKQ